jgi:protein-S-isoprenylcysteine O-methyltransferase Ste14
MNPESAPQRPTAVLKLGKFTLTGTPAIAGLVVLLLGITAGIIALRPTLRMLLSGGLWIVFVAYWSAAARNAAATKSAESRESRRLHETMLNAALLLLFVPIPGLRARFVPLLPLIVVSGLALQAGAILLAVWARRHLGRNWSGAITQTVDHQLVQSGPYRLVRHPIYSAMLGLFIGTALVSGELHALIAVTVIVIAYWRKVRLEERHLRTVFGARYDEYRHGTWAVVPYLL